MRPKKKTLRAKADSMFSKLIRARDGSCERCGNPDNLQCAHVWSRRYLSTRWDERNALALCRGCHVYFTMHPAHWHEWIVERMGQAQYEALRKRAITSAGPPNYEGIIARLEVGLMALEVA